MRYADDFVIGFERQDDAERVRAVLREADGALRTDSSSGQDAPAGLPAPAGGPAGRERSGHLRLPGVHAALASNPQGSLADDVQDKACAPATGRSGRRRLVSSPSTLPVTVQHAALWSRIRGHFNYFGINGNFRSLACLAYEARACLVQVAPPSQPADAPHLGEVRRAVAVLSSPPSSDRGPNLGA